MTYYVFAIHTDDTNNRLYGEYPSLQAADKVERDMRAGNYPGDNYFVRMIVAETQREAEAKADALRPKPKLK
jgi:hypothetical protein